MADEARPGMRRKESNMSDGDLFHADRADNTSPSSRPFVKSQAHLLRPTEENPQPTAVPPPIAAVAGTLGDRHVLCLIGLPERGKPFIAKRLMGYLAFFHGASVKLFDLREYKERAGAPPGSEENAQLLLEDLMSFMSGTSREAAGNLNVPHDTESVDDSDRRSRSEVDSGKVAIIIQSDSYGAFEEKWAGTSKERRRWAVEKLRATPFSFKLIYIEVIVTDEELLKATIRAKNGIRADDEAGTLACLRELSPKIVGYQRKYVTLQDDGSEDDISYIKLINYGQKVVTNRMHGYLRMRIAQFLSVIHPTPHVIYLSRHGQSEYNKLGKIGGNPPLSESGSEYARRLGDWVIPNISAANGRLVKCRLWTSSLQRTILTGAHIPHPLIPESAFSTAEPHAEEECLRPGESGAWEQFSPRVHRNLDEIFAGEYEGMRYEEIKALAPSEAHLRSMDKIGYRYPRGESYFDIIARLDPLVHEIESYHESLLLISHQAVLRLLYSYLMGRPRSGAPKLEIPLHTVIRITYDGWSAPREERFFLGPTPPEASDGQKDL